LHSLQQKGKAFQVKKSKNEEIKTHIKKEGAMKRLVRFLMDEQGVSAIEYGLIASLVAIALIVGATLLGTKLNAVFTTTAGSM
jgi:pilus assembly protein Flp/PilA